MSVLLKILFPAWAEAQNSPLSNCYWVVSRNPSGRRGFHVLYSYSPCQMLSFVLRVHTCWRLKAQLKCFPPLMSSSGGSGHLFRSPVQERTKSQFHSPLLSPSLPQIERWEKTPQNPQSPLPIWLILSRSFEKGLPWATSPEPMAAAASASGGDTPKQLFSIIRDFAYEKSHGEHRVSDLRRRFADARAAVGAAAAELDVAKRAREATGQDLRRSQVQAVIAANSILALEATISCLQEEISKASTELDALKVREWMCCWRFTNLL